LDASLEAAVADGGGNALIVNASRSIIFASGDSDFDEAARRETQKLGSAIESALHKAESL
jgi:hypothetical protein